MNKISYVSCIIALIATSLTLLDKSQQQTEIQSRVNQHLENLKTQIDTQRKPRIQEAIAKVMLKKEAQTIEEFYPELHKLNKDIETGFEYNKDTVTSYEILFIPIVEMLKNLIG